MKNHLEAAKNLIFLGDEKSLMYAALELRMAIEIWVNKKLNLYAKHYGRDVLFSRWQQNKSLKILKQLDPLSDQSFELSMKEENNPDAKYVSLGKHESLEYPWVNKNYNKLGSRLHWQGTESSQEERLSYLKSIAKELERVASSQLDTNITDLINFECSLCDSKIYASSKALEQCKEVACLQGSCNATYEVSNDESGSWQFLLSTDVFICPSCSHTTEVLSTELKMGYRVLCKGCKKKYYIGGQEFKVRAES